MSNDAREQLDEGRKGTGQVTRRDLKWMIAGIIAVILLLIPLYKMLKDDRDRHICKRNLGQLSKAMGIYAELNTGRLPPAYDADPDGNPTLSKGRAASWITVVSPMVDETRNQFLCPACSEAAASLNQGGKTGTIQGSYGFYGALSTRPISDIPNPQNAVMIAETSNKGEDDTYNPSPFPNGASDGFVIGFDTTNFPPRFDRSPMASAKWATRLAFPGTDKKPGGESSGRHNDSIYVLYADGHVEMRKSGMMKVKHLGTTVTDMWAER